MPGKKIQSKEAKSPETAALLNMLEDLEEERNKAVEAKKDFKWLADNLINLVYRADPHTYKAVYINNAVKNLYGYSPKEWLSNPVLWEKAIHPDDKERVFNFFDNARKKKASSVCTYRIITKSKKVKFVEDHFGWQKGRDGKLTALSGIMYDVTEKRLAEDKIKEKEELLRNIVENSFDGIFNIGKSGKIIYANKKYAKMFGYSPKEILKMKDWSPMVPIKAMARAEKNFKNILSGKTVKDEIICLRKDRSEFLASFVSSPVMENGKVVSITGYIRDITQEKNRKNKISMLSSVVENSTEFIGMSAMDETLLYINKKGMKMLGLNGISKIKNISELIPEESRSLLRKAVSSTIKMGFWRGTLPFKNFKRKAPLKMDLIGFIVKDPGNNPIGMAAVAREVIGKESQTGPDKKSKRKNN